MNEHTIPKFIHHQALFYDDTLPLLMLVGFNFPSQLQSDWSVSRKNVVRDFKMKKH